MASVLLFNVLDPGKTNLLQVLSIRLNFAYRQVAPEYQGCTIRDLLDQRFDRPIAVKPFCDEMLVMDGLDHQDLNFLLNELIRTGLTIRLKAVVTPTNRNWTAVMLHTQLVAENRAMNISH